MRVMCALTVAAVVVGVGQAQAATHNVTFELTFQEYHCEISPCDESAKPNEAFFKGLPLFTALTGQLILPNAVSTPSGLLYAEGGIQFISSGVTYSLGYFEGDGISFFEHKTMIWGYEISYDGLSGYLNFRDDDAPYSRELRGVISAVNPAPVPLPVSAALLPLGIGALATMRRRRRSV